MTQFIGLRLNHGIFWARASRASLSAFAGRALIARRSLAS
jgi:hypothetical protein